MLSPPINYFVISLKDAVDRILEKKEKVLNQEQFQDIIEND